MSRYEQEPPFVHGTPSRAAVVVVNLGTPEAPTATAVRRYLKEFLGDPRVVEIPRLAWVPILHGIILNLRPRQSAQKYARIWSSEGSPLMVHTRRQASLLASRLGERMRSPLAVEFAMRYGSPSIASVLARLTAAGCYRIVVLPLYPQYAASTTATAFDEVARFVQRTRNVPELRMVRHFHDHPAYIAALAAQVREYWSVHGRPDKLLMSFHGLPRYTLEKGDPYHCECQKTGRLLAEALSLADGQWQLTFQSRFGRTEWLRPYTLQTLLDEAQRGARRIDVFCPGFVSDCLETLEEIGIECREAFLSSGGKEFHFIPCLNERDDWMQALADIAQAALGDWMSPDWNADAARAQQEGSRKRALALGAKA